MRVRGFAALAASSFARLRLDLGMRLLGKRRSGIGGLHGKRMLGALAHARAALDAAEPVHGPRAGLLIHRNGLRGQRFWQMLHRCTRYYSTHMTLEAFRHGRVCTGYRTVSGLPKSDRKVIFPNLKLPMSPYLSQQLMQGSMVRMILGTSANSQPSRALTIPARFWLVGVRMRMRSRFLVPLPRAK